MKPFTQSPYKLIGDAPKVTAHILAERQMEANPKTHILHAHAKKSGTCAGRRSIGRVDRLRASGTLEAVEITPERPLGQRTTFQPVNELISAFEVAQPGPYGKRWDW